MGTLLAQVTSEEQKQAKQEISLVESMAKDLIVKTPEQSQEAQGVLKKIKIKKAEFHEKFDPPVRSAHKAWKSAKELYNFFLQPFDRAERTIKQKVLAFENERERAARQKAREEQAKAESAERKKREALERKAKAAEAKGQMEKAEALRDSSEKEYSAPVAPVCAPDPIVAKGPSFREVWKGQVLDVEALMKAILDKRAPQNLLIVDQSALNSFAKGVKDTLPVPGVKFYSEKIMFTRSN